MTIINDVWELYQSAQQAHPFIGSVLVAVGTFSLSDIVSQLIVDKKVNWKKVGYTTALSPIYGAGIYGLIESGHLVGEYISDHALVKAALGPNFWGHALNAYFFVNNTIGEKGNYSIKKNVKHYADMFSKESLKNFGQTFKNKFINNIPKKEYINAVIGSLTFWNAFHYINYTYVQDEMQTPITLGFSVVWTTLITAWSLKGARKLTYDKDST